MKDILTKINYNINDLSDITSMDDFYEKTKLFRLIEKEKTLIAASQLYINPKDRQTLQTYMIQNFKKRPKEFRYMSAKHWEKAVQFDFDCFAPMPSEEVPQNELWVLRSENN